VAGEEPTLVERDIIIRERELQLREREVVAKEKEVSKSRWSHPLILALLAAAAGLIGNVVVAIVNNDNTQKIEHSHAQSSLILEAIKTGDNVAACKNLNFFAKLGLLDDAKGNIASTCPGDKNNGVPTLPAGGDHRQSSFLKILVTDAGGIPISGARVSDRDSLGNGDNCETNDAGLCVLPPLPQGDRLSIRVEKTGYKSQEVTYVWTGDVIHISLSK
jgi:hypothetical protein